VSCAVFVGRHFSAAGPFQDHVHPFRPRFGSFGLFDPEEQNCPTHGAFIHSERLQDDFNRGCMMFTYIHKDLIVGFVELEKKSDDLFVLEKLAVIPRCRHNGFGRELVAFCEEKAREMGGKVLSIGIIEENARLKTWYEENGFIHTGTKKFSHLPFTVGFMEIRLDGGSGLIL
jgi:diamine N-acetyltransferase